MNENHGDDNETETEAEELDQPTHPAPESGTQDTPAGKDPADPGDVPEGAQYGGKEPNPQG